MTQCREAMNSPVANKDGSYDRTFLVADVTDDEQAQGLAAAAAGASFRGCDRDDLPDMRPFGHSLWEVTYHYAAPDSPTGQGTSQGDPPSPGSNDDDLDAVIEFDTSGGTAHVTQCISQESHGPEDGSDIVNAKVVGASGDSVEGTDVVTPKLSISLSRRPPAINGNYIKNLARLTGKTNSAVYKIRGIVLGVYCEIEFQQEELLFMGAAPTGKEVWKDGRFIYKFEASESVLALNVGNDANGGDVVIPVKNGWEYVWMLFGKKELTKPKVAIPITRLAFVSKMQESLEYKNVLGF